MRKIIAAAALAVLALGACSSAPATPNDQAQRFADSVVVDIRNDVLATVSADKVKANAQARAKTTAFKERSHCSVPSIRLGAAKDEAEIAELEKKVEPRVRIEYPDPGIGYAFAWAPVASSNPVYAQGAHFFGILVVVDCSANPQPGLGDSPAPTVSAT